MEKARKDEQKMNQKQIIGAVVAAGLFIVTGVSSVLTNTLSERMLADTAKKTEDALLGGNTTTLPGEPYIGIVAVEGTIQEQTSSNGIFDTVAGYQHDTTLDYIDRMMEDEKNQGILLRVDSPGGTVYESEELYRKLVAYKEETGRPVWTYMEHYAASGGYYISAPSDKIYANPNTTTGSIGVIMSGYDMSGLYEKLGIRSVSITSGKNKDMSKLTEEQIAIYQSSVDESFDRFVEIVADGRKMTEETVREIADGRTYTAKQAKANGLIDEISLYEEMQEAMEQETGCTTFYEPEQGVSPLASLFSKLETLKPKSEAEVLTEWNEDLGRGVLMYYAEQLQ